MFLEHVNLTVANLERSVEFYRRALEFRVRWRGTTSEGRPAAHVGDDRCFLALFEGVSSDPAPAPDYEHAGFNHLCFVVQDLVAAKARLADIGVRPHFEPNYDPGQRLYFMDPDNIEVELVQYASPEEAISQPGSAS
ncbi:MAG: catechol 2,3-dioxygenase-like lactoylglutathione lyase family enzyme [Planctomycetota bacterium]|jgi:catechol 2,3-dioxygenase-like lactoylglutathione lyase family enzyme